MVTNDIEDGLIIFLQKLSVLANEMFMSEDFEKDCLAEGSEKVRTNSNWTPNTFRGALAIVVIGGLATAVINKIVELRFTDSNEVKQDSSTLISEKKLD